MMAMEEDTDECIDLTLSDSDDDVEAMEVVDERKPQSTTVKSDPMSPSKRAGTKQETPGFSSKKAKVDASILQHSGQQVKQPKLGNETSAQQGTTPSTSSTVTSTSTMLASAVVSSTTTTSSNPKPPTMNLEQSLNFLVQGSEPTAPRVPAMSLSLSSGDTQVDEIQIKLIKKSIEDSADALNGEGENPPWGLRVRLLPHQKVGYGWMLRQEEGTCKGGILADDMGLGKTVQTLSTMLKRFPRPANPKGNKREPFRNLIICPLNIVQQWQEEINRLSKMAELQICVYHGSDKIHDPHKLAQQDFVITSFQTLALEREPTMEECNTGKKTYRPWGPLFCVKWYRVVLDEASHIKNPNSDACKACCALSADYRWCLTGTPIQNSIRDLFALFKFLKYKPYNDSQVFSNAFEKSFGTSAETRLRRLQTALTAICLRRKKDGMVNGKKIIELPPKEIIIVIEEFTPEEKDHYMALETSSQLRFSKFLKAGTVMKNYANILLLLLRLRQACDHPLLDKDLMAKAEKFQYTPYRDLSTKAKIEYKAALLDDDDDEELPDVFGKVKEEQGTMMIESPVVRLGRLRKMTVAQLRAELSTRGMQLPSNCLKDTLVLLLFQLQDSDDMAAMAASSSTTSAAPKKKKLTLKPEVLDRVMSNVDESKECSICLDTAVRSDSIFTPCGHIFCKECIGNYFQSERFDPTCPSCRAPITPDNLVPAVDVLPEVDLADLDEILKSNEFKDEPGDANASGPATGTTTDDKETEDQKIRRIEKEVIEGMQKFVSKPISTKISKCIAIIQGELMEDSKVKFLLFSQFTSMFDLLEEPFKTSDIDFLRYEGGMNRQERSKTLKAFRAEDGPSVLMCSLKCASFGLNLIEATRVILFDPWWNPTVEDQAVDRCHRLGQMEKVKVYRLQIQDTVEQRIWALQEKKRALAAGAFDEKQKGANQQLSVDDLMTLFNVDRSGNARNNSVIPPADEVAPPASASRQEKPKGRRYRRCKVNINKASLSHLLRIQGVGKTTAESVVAARLQLRREEQRVFRDKDDINEYLIMHHYRPLPEHLDLEF